MTHRRTCARPPPAEFSLAQLHYACATLHHANNYNTSKKLKIAAQALWEVAGLLLVRRIAVGTIAHMPSTSSAALLSLALQHSSCGHESGHTSTHHWMVSRRHDRPNVTYYYCLSRAGELCVGISYLRSSRCARGWVVAVPPAC